jgi:hypothetical protein
VGKGIDELMHREIVDVAFWKGDRVFGRRSLKVLKNFPNYQYLPIFQQLFFRDNSSKPVGYENESK